MKVIQLLPELNEGGVERGVVDLNRDLVKNGLFESIVVSAGGKQAKQIDLDGGKHITFDVCSKNLLSVPGRILRLRKLLNDLQPDILHARSRVPAWLAYLANKPLKTPFVTTVHGFNSVNLYSRVMTFGDKVICVSQAVKKYVQQHYQVAEEKIAVIPRGVDLDLFNPETVDRDIAVEISRKYRLDGKFVVSAVGRITQLKDYETFIRALALAREKIPNIAGLIVGGVRADKKDYFQTLQALVNQLDASDFIHFPGSFPRTVEIYAISDIIVSCSKKPESFGRTAAEAMAMNVPVIATDHGGITDIVVDGKTGLLVEPGQPELLAERIKMMPSSHFIDLRKWIADHFSLTQMVQKTNRLYLDATRQ